MIYKVTKQYGKGSETIDKDFQKRSEAEQHALSAAEADAAMKVKVIYRVYEFDDLLQEIDTEKLTLNEKGSGQSESASGKGQAVSFKPTPLSTTPRPKGGPEGWVKDTDEEDESR